MLLLKLVSHSHKEMELYFCFSTAADLKEKILNFALIPNCASERGKTETSNL